jgi:CheY-like chemotaxis protein
MVHGFAKQSRGHVSIDSKVGVGTTVRIYLPRAMEGPSVAPSPAAVVPVAAAAECVLVVEDNADVRNLVCTLLTSLGYQVEAALDGAAALEALARRDDISLLLTDVVLTGALNGPQLAERARLRRPGLRIVFMSGYTEDTMLQGGRLKRGVRLLQKPFTKSALATIVRGALEAPTDA